MRNRYIITEENAKEIKEYRKKIKDKKKDRRMYAVQLVGEGMKYQMIAEKLDCKVQQVGVWVKKYAEQGIEGLNPKLGGRHHENMTLEEEKEFLEQFGEIAEAGKIVEGTDIQRPSPSRMEKDKAEKQTSEKSKCGGNKCLKKINQKLEEKRVFHNLTDGKKVRLMFQDEAGFGRINKPKYCWCKKGFRPSVPCHHVREYRYAYGAVEPLTGESFFLIMPYCDTECINMFLQELSKKYADDVIILVCDGAGWHKSKSLTIPKNIEIVFIPPYTPEMNPIEQIWEEIREKGFRNECFRTLTKVVDRLCDTIRSLSVDTIMSITHRDWIISCI